MERRVPPEWRLFPAYAGVILMDAIRVRMDSAFPRIRGGDPMHMADGKRQVALSPHMRG